ncbi:MAG: T9SS type A sorting domain-containing protein, partial [Marinilabiliaceae bacterium]|nr:T9SS type A sorting domain-containing protein [Marinilabiliaceae bacterium]
YYICDSIWYPPLIFPKTRTLPETIYETALDYLSEEDYGAAQTSFIDLIENHAETPFANAALHELLALQQFTDQDFNGLRTYFETFTVSDTTLYETAQFLSTRCNVLERQWQPAIDWYENRIENPPSYPDSIFAVIDLGDIYLRMEGDTLGMELKSKTFILSRFPEFIPKSKSAFERTKSALLATLPQKQTLKTVPPIAIGNEKGALGQNIPNPARVSTTVEYAIYIDGNVEIKLFNALGQLVETFSEGTKETGIYSIEIPLSKIPEGFYHYALYINGERVEAKTMVRN